MRRIASSRRGAVLVEFALVSFLFLGLAFVVIELIRANATVGGMEEAKRVAAATLERLPAPSILPADSEEEFEDSRVFDERYTVIDLDALIDPEGNPVASLDALFKVLPPLHSSLRSAMIRDDRDGRRLLRFPGALLHNSAFPPGRDFLVRIPLRTQESSPTQLGSSVQVVLKRIVGLSQRSDGLTSVKIRCHFQFTTLLDQRDSDEQTRRRIDDVNVQHDAAPEYATDLASYQQLLADGFSVVTWDLGRLRGLGANNLFRNFIKSLQVETGAGYGDRLSHNSNEFEYEYHPQRVYPQPSGSLSNLSVVTADLGRVYYLPSHRAWFRLLQVSATSPAIQEKQAAEAGTGAFANWTVGLGSSGSVTFAGVRVSGAEELQPGDIGLFQVSGIATFLTDGASPVLAQGGAMLGANGAITPATLGNPECIGISSQNASTAGDHVEIKILNCVYEP